MRAGMGVAALAVTLALLTPLDRAEAALCDDPAETECINARLEAYICARRLTENSFIETAGSMQMTPQQLVALSASDPDRLASMLRDHLVEASRGLAAIIEAMLLIENREEEGALIKDCVEVLGESPFD